MSYANLPQDYAAKKKRITDACALKIPDQVPILTFNGTWGFAYANVKIADVLHNGKKQLEAFLKWCDDIYTDAYYAPSIAAGLNMIEVLNPPFPTYRITDDGFGYEHQQAMEDNGGMLPDEYPLLIADVRKYLLEVITPRHYPVLKEPYPKNYEALKKTFDAFMEFMEPSSTGAVFAKERYGVPAISTGYLLAPLDALFSFLRGFKGIAMDMRQRPELVLAAADALEEYLEKLLLSMVKKGNVLTAPLLLPPFLGQKNFEKFYWPSFRKIINAAIKKGAKVNLVLEGAWMPYMSYLKEFPRGSIIGMIDQDDIFECKKKHGDHITLVGGMPCDLLRFGTKDECVTLSRRLIDQCAPGGGYIFCVDKQLQYANDINIDNYKAAVETILKYGRS